MGAKHRTQDSGKKDASVMNKVEETNMIPDEVIMSKVFIIRDQRVMVDSDMGELYGVTTKRLNEAVKRNLNRFPIDFMFQLTLIEKEELVANCDHLIQGLGAQGSGLRA